MQPEAVAVGFTVFSIGAVLAFARESVTSWLGTTWRRHVTEPRRTRAVDRMREAVQPIAHELAELRCENAEQHAAVEGRLGDLENRSTERFDHLDRRVDDLYGHLLNDRNGQ